MESKRAFIRRALILSVSFIWIYFISGSQGQTEEPVTTRRPAFMPSGSKKSLFGFGEGPVATTTEVNLENEKLGPKIGIDTYAAPEQKKPAPYDGLQGFKRDYQKYSWPNETWEQFENRGKYGIFLDPYMNRATGDLLYYSRVIYEVIDSDAIDAKRLKLKIRQFVTPIISVYRYAVEEHNFLDNLPMFDEVFKTYDSEGNRELLE